MSGPVPAIGHIPFPGHRSMAQVNGPALLPKPLTGLELFAEYLADDCEPVVAARLAGYQPNDAAFLVRLLRDQLGKQAR